MEMIQMWHEKGENVLQPLERCVKFILMHSNYFAKDLIVSLYFFIIFSLDKNVLNWMSLHSLALADENV